MDTRNLKKITTLCLQTTCGQTQHKVLATSNWDKTNTCENIFTMHLSLNVSQRVLWRENNNVLQCYNRSKKKKELSISSSHFNHAGMSCQRDERQAKKNEIDANFLKIVTK